MAGSELVPVPDSPILLLRTPGEARPWLLLADTHIGLSAPARSAGGPPGASAEAMADVIVRVARQTRARGVFHLGDVKDPIVGTPPQLRKPIFDFFGRILSEGLRVELVLGNHDAGLVRHLPREVRVHPASGVARYGVGMFHGHRWPGPGVLGARSLVAGHLHPGVRLAPAASGTAPKQRCWVRVRFRSPTPKRDGPSPARKFAARQMIVLPPFNPIAGTEALNRDRPARGRTFVYREFLGRGTARAYLLDGTDLGEIIPAPAFPRRRAGLRSPRAP
jgi:uncharacterized protein